MFWHHPFFKDFCGRCSHECCYGITPGKFKLVGIIRLYQCFRRRIDGDRLLCISGCRRRVYCYLGGVQ